MEETNLMTRKALNDAYAVCPWLIENLKHLISNPESEMLKVMIKHDLLLIKRSISNHMKSLIIFLKK